MFWLRFFAVSDQVCGLFLSGVNASEIWLVFSFEVSRNSGDEDPEAFTRARTNHRYFVMAQYTHKVFLFHFQE